MGACRPTLFNISHEHDDTWSLLYLRFVIMLRNAVRISSHYRPLSEQMNQLGYVTSRAGCVGTRSCNDQHWSVITWRCVMASKYSTVDTMFVLSQCHRPFHVQNINHERTVKKKRGTMPKFWGPTGRVMLKPRWRRRALLDTAFGDSPPLSRDIYCDCIASQIGGISRVFQILAIS